MPEKAEELEKLLNEWSDELINPRFLGLIHTEKGIREWGRPKRWLEADEMRVQR